MFSPISFAPFKGRRGLGDFKGFFYQLKDTRRENWSDMQNWIAVLLVMCLIFNDPLFPLEIYLDLGIWITALYIIFLCCFVSFMMFFWMVVMHDCSKQGTPEADKPKGSGFYILKSIFCSSFCILMTVIYVNIRMQQQGDPSYDTLEVSLLIKTRNNNESQKREGE